MALISVWACRAEHMKLWVRNSWSESSGRWEMKDLLNRAQGHTAEVAKRHP